MCFCIIKLTIVLKWKLILCSIRYHNFLLDLDVCIKTNNITADITGADYESVLLHSLIESNAPTNLAFWEIDQVCKPTKLLSCELWYALLTKKSDSCWWSHVNHTYMMARLTVNTMISAPQKLLNREYFKRFGGKISLRYSKEEKARKLRKHPIGRGFMK